MSDQPLRILIIEDEMTIALMLEEMLLELGHEVVAVAMRLPRAIELAGCAAVDCAILDVNLDGRMSFPVADVLAERGVPFLFATGYGEAGLAGDHRGRLTITKPFLRQDVARAICEVLG